MTILQAISDADRTGVVTYDVIPISEAAAIIIAEAQKVPTPQSLATIAQALHMMRLQLGPHREEPARITHYDGRLLDEYAEVREQHYLIVEIRS